MLCTRALLVAALLLGAGPSHGGQPTWRERFRSRIQEKIRTTFRSRRETSAQEPAPVPEGFRLGQIQVGAVPRYFLYRLPSSPRPRAPLLILLHGGTGNMARSFQGETRMGKGWIRACDREGWVLLAPNGTNPETGDTRSGKQLWNDLREGGQVPGSEADDVAFLDALLDWSQSELDTDPARVLVTGGSNGGMMTLRYALERPGRIAGAAAFLAALPDLSVPLPELASPVPLLMVNGDQDQWVRWEGGPVARRRAPTRSVPETVSWWVSANRAEPEPEVSLAPDLDPEDGCRAERRVYPARPGGAPVHAIRLRGAGHVPPLPTGSRRLGPMMEKVLGRACHDVEAVSLALQFFRRTVPGLREP